MSAVPRPVARFMILAPPSTGRISVERIISTTNISVTREAEGNLRQSRSYMLL